ncbi:sugar phosphate nucleotidyltransferase [Lutispora thermophila]|uniref:Mannose-1-phosphate guanylyltransferase / phosphomannomutase n=1 Tax=Lutispora thermophila DSM 19022 TaxID=1122184 RepID=A0A1M6CCY7_9FIRM|nr:sugar phosphate nucleotidyltransferase [Lutispora thermophila]SHI58879.1 mannose-1-phosphate guanylyltransferase / phosphomannomutase [Lutispora thermophila DSM 19022]
MAGGKGTRLRPLTCGIPKPMVPVFDKPVMEYTIQLLKDKGIHDIGVTVAYLPQVIMDYFGDGSGFGVKLKYFIEDTPLGTGGSVRNTGDFLNSTFVVISGDALTNLDLTKTLDFHKNMKSKATLVLKREPVPIEYGVVITDSQGLITRFLEKPSWGEVFSDTVNTGIYILEPEVMEYYKPGESFDFSKDLFPKLLRDKVPMYGYVTDDYWCDIGDLASYRQVHFDILDGKVNLALEATEFQKGIWLAEGAQIRRSATLVPPVYIGKNTIIEDNVLIDSYSVISQNCRLGSNSKVKRSVLWKKIHVGENCGISGGVICSNSLIKNNVDIYENSVIGENTTILEGCIIKPDVRIWPGKKIYENTIVNHNIIWGTKATKNIFGSRGISGTLNLELSPELCSSLGSAFAAAMGKNATLVVGSDSNPQSYIAKSSLIAGILSVGGQAIVLDNSIISMTRFGVAYHRANGGVHIHTSNEKPCRTYIEFFDEKGINISRSKEREIENLLNQDDYDRCKAEDIKDIMRMENFQEIFIRQGLERIQNLDGIRRKNFKIVLASHSENTTAIAYKYLQNLGCSISLVWGRADNIIDSGIYKYMAGFVTRKKADLGVIINENGESLTLIDERGRVAKEEEYLLLTELVAIKGYGAKHLVFPHAFPGAAEEIAKNNGVKIYRTSSTPAEIMKKMMELGDGTNNPSIQFILNNNGVWAIGHIIEYMVKENTKISKLIDSIPEYYYLKKEINCDWKDKGRIIREIAFGANQEDIELIEGVKIKDSRGWALVLPDNERPVFNIYAEGYSQEMAQELSADLSEKINLLLRNQRL